MAILQIIKKRNGEFVPFDAEKIIRAIERAGTATGEFGREIAETLAQRVLALISQKINSEIPQIEEIQDIVEEILLIYPFKKTA